ncbi:MAG: hypothetical protein AAF702_43090 [Chloroflexota bacterium]
MSKQRILVTVSLTLITILLMGTAVYALGGSNGSKTVTPADKLQFIVVVKDEDVANHTRFDNLKAHIAQNPENPFDHEPRVEQLAYYTDVAAGVTVFTGVADATNMISPDAENDTSTLTASGEETLLAVLDGVFQSLNSGGEVPFHYSWVVVTLDGPDQVNTQSLKGATGGTNVGGG